MQTYEVRLESPSGLPRILSLGADSEDAARAQAMQRELEICDFSLLPPAREVWEDPRLDNTDDAHVDARLWDAYDPAFRRVTATHTDYGDAKRAGEARLADWMSRVEVAKSGKIVNAQLGDRSKGRLANHLQAEPFTIVDVRAVPPAEIDAMRLVREAKMLAQHDPAKWQGVLQDLRDGGIPLAAVTAALYGVPTKNRSDGTANGQIDWHNGTSDTFKAMLTTSSYTVDLDTHAFKNATGLTTNEATGTNWSAGGATLGTLASSYDGTSDQARYDAADISVATTTVTFRNIVVYKSTGTDSTSPLIAYVNVGASDVSTTAGTLGVTWDATGVWLVDCT